MKWSKALRRTKRRAIAWTPVVFYIMAVLFAYGFGLSRFLGEPTNAFLLKDGPGVRDWSPLIIIAVIVPLFALGMVRMIQKRSKKTIDDQTEDRLYTRMWLILTVGAFIVGVILHYI